MRRAVEVADVGEHLAPLAGQQVDHVHALGLALEQRRLRAEEVDMGVGRHPAALAPAEHPLQLERQRLGLGVDVTARRSGAISYPRVISTYTVPSGRSTMQSPST